MTTATGQLRTLRISPRDLMTGDLLVEKGRTGIVEDVVTWVEPTQGGRFWRVTTVRGGGTYATQRRLTVKRQGPKGFGE